MAKLPQWYSKTVTDTNTTPTEALKDAAKILRIDAKDYRREKNHDGAHAAERIAAALDRVAAGTSWKEAFELRE